MSDKIKLKQINNKVEKQVKQEKKEILNKKEKEQKQKLDQQSKVQKDQKEQKKQQLQKQEIEQKVLKQENEQNEKKQEIEQKQQKQENYQNEKKKNQDQEYHENQEQEEQVQEQQKEEKTIEKTELEKLLDVIAKLSSKEQNEKLRGYYFKCDSLEEIPDEHFFRNKNTKGSKGDSKSKIGYCYHPTMLLHKNERDHVERPQRIECIDYHLNEVGLLHKLFHIEVQECPDTFVLHLHSQKYVDDINHQTEDQFTLFSPSGDIFLNKFTKQAAYLAAGACKQATDQVCQGNLKQVLCNIRPPGHHAHCKDDEPTGFCFLNNVAISAKYALANYKNIKKILIFDWDVHHGDGTQRAFYENEQVLFISLHLFNNAGFYPYSPDAHFSKIGQNKGEGYNINISWNSQKVEQDYKVPGNAEYIFVCQTLLFPIISEFQPDLIYISAGFDSAKGDPLGGIEVEPKAYSYMMQGLLKIQQKLIVVLEGGYNKQALSYASEAIVRTLLAENLPFPSLNIPEKSWKQVEQEVKVNQFIIDMFYPHLVKLLSPHWKCVKDMMPKYQKQIDQLKKEDYIPPEKGCLIF